MLPLTTFYRSGAHRSDVYKWDAFVTSWRFYNRAWQPERHDCLPETSGTLWIHRGALTNQRCSLATGCGIIVFYVDLNYRKAMCRLLYKCPVIMLALMVHGANMGPSWVLSAPGRPPCWPHKPCYQGVLKYLWSVSVSNDSVNTAFKVRNSRFIKIFLVDFPNYNQHIKSWI